MKHLNGWQLRATLIAPALLALGGCGGDVYCISGVPCGPVPSFAEPQPAPVTTAQRFAAIGLGHNHSCMLTAAGATWCWGDNQYGQLGAASGETCVEGAGLPCSSRPLAVAGGASFTSLAAAVRHSCGLTSAGAAWCWGFGLGGQLGDGRRTNSLMPRQVGGGHVFVAPIWDATSAKHRSVRLCSRPARSWRISSTARMPTCRCWSTRTPQMTPVAERLTGLRNDPGLPGTRRGVPRVLS